MRNTKVTNYTEWTLSDIKNGKLIQSNLLKKYNFEHGFYSKDSENFKPSELSQYITKSDCSIHFLNQVHSNKIIVASETSDTKHSEADAMISNRCKQSLWIYSADCIPLLFADKETGLVAAVHSGWRGLAKKIIPVSVKKFISCGSNLQDIIVAIGPAISKNKYQVNLDVYDAVVKTFIEINEKESMFIQNKKEPISYKDFSEEKANLDIRVCAKRQLLLSGVLPQNIAVNRNCTFSEFNLFNSWRRDQKKSLQWSAIVSR